MARRSNQSILKEISPEYSLQGWTLKLKPQYFGHLMQRTDSLEKTLMLGMIESRRRRDDRGRDGWMASPTQWTWVWVSSRSGWWTGKPGMLQSMESQFCFIDYAKAFDCVDHNKLWKILKEMGIPDHLTCLLRNLYIGQEATVRTGHATTGWFQIRNGVRQGCTLSPCLFNFYAEYIMRNSGLKEHRLESRLPGELSITSDMQMTPPLWQKVKRN